MSLKIIKLTARNFMRIKAVEIVPGGNMVQIRGKNSNGKSSVLNAIAVALGGKRLCPPKPIRDGEKRADISVDLGEYIATRTFTENDSYLTVKSKDGAKIANPQQLLDSLIGAISFDPLEFARMKATDQAKQLAEITGVNFEGLNSERANLFASRTEVNRRVASLKPTVASGRKEVQAYYGDTKYLNTRSLSDATRELKEAQDAHNAHAEKQRKLHDLVGSEQALKDEVDRLTKELTKATFNLNVCQEQIKAQRVENDAEAEKLPDIGAAYNAFEEIEAHNAIVTKVQDFFKLEKQLKEESEKSESLTRSIEAIDRKKAELVAKADLPVNHLSFDESGVYYKGVPFEQCSSSEQLKVSTALAISFNPKLRVIRITDGSLLDEESLGVLESIAESEDFQIWLEKVDDSESGVGILIEDGCVVAVGDRAHIAAA